jgi:hypothetical protein
MTFRVIPVLGAGAEDVVVAVSGPDEGAVFTGTADGAIQRISHDGRRVERVAQTGGRPLGIEFLPDGRLLVCDARRGVLVVDPRNGSVEMLVADVEGRPMRFCNNAAVAADGTFYFSDSSAVHGIDEWKADVVELTRTGRLLRRSVDGKRRGAARRARVRQRRHVGRGRVLRRGGRDGHPDRRTPLADRAERGNPRLPRRGPSGLSGQHCPRQRRADLGDDRQPA